MRRALNPRPDDSPRPEDVAEGTAAGLGLGLGAAAGVGLEGGCAVCRAAFFLSQIEAGFATSGVGLEGGEVTAEEPGVGVEEAGLCEVWPAAASLDGVASSVVVVAAAANLAASLSLRRRRADRGARVFGATVTNAELIVNQQLWGNERVGNSQTMSVWVAMICPVKCKK